MLLVLAIPFFAKANTLEERRLAEQREKLRCIQSSTGDEESMITCVSSDALTRITLHNESHQIFCWRALDDLGMPANQPKVNMTYAQYNYRYLELEAISIVENSEVLNMSYTTTNIPMLEYIQEKITNDIPKDHTSNKVHTLALVIQIRNESNPFYQVNFVKDKFMELGTNSPEYEKLLNELKWWFATLNDILNNPILQEGENLVSTEKEETASPLDIELPDSTSRPTIQEDEVTALNEMGKSYHSIEQKKMDPMVIPEQKEDQLPYTAKKPQDPSELSYFEKLVAKNKRQLDSKGPSEKG